LHAYCTRTQVRCHPIRRVSPKNVSPRCCSGVETIGRMRWEEFAAAAPELAGVGRELLERAGLCFLGTLRRNGWPRISPCEPFIVDGELMLGMMWQSRKARDLLRDPRLTLHNAHADRVGAEGDFKLYGRALDVTDPAQRERYAQTLKEKIA
jgi:hypothetical protein